MSDALWCSPANEMLSCVLPPFEMNVKAISSFNISDCVLSTSIRFFCMLVLKGEWWDHVAFDRAHKLVLAVVGGVRVVAVHPTVVLGSRQAIEGVLSALACSRTINTSFVVRQHATARCQNARRSRRTCWFSEDREIHEDDFVSQRQSGTEPMARVIIPSTDGKSKGPPPRSFRTTFRSAIPSGLLTCA